MSYSKLDIKKVAIYCRIGIDNEKNDSKLMEREYKKFLNKVTQKQKTQERMKEKLKQEISRTIRNYIMISKHKERTTY